MDMKAIKRSIKRVKDIIFNPITLLYIVLPIILISIGIGLIYLIGSSDLSDWVKFLLLR